MNAIFKLITKFTIPLLSAFPVILSNISDIDPRTLILIVPIEDSSKLACFLFLFVFLVEGLIGVVVLFEFACIRPIIAASIRALLGGVSRLEGKLGRVYDRGFDA